VSIRRHSRSSRPATTPKSDPLAGLEAALKLFAFGEKLGFDGAWVRQRHLERGVSSAATFLAAATQRTRRIELGAAVIQMGYENPFRLAEDLATVDVLSRGRLQVGLSAGAPLHGALLGNRFTTRRRTPSTTRTSAWGGSRPTWRTRCSATRRPLSSRPAGACVRACSRMRRGWSSGSGTAAARCVRPNGRGATASTCCWATCCRARPPTTFLNAQLGLVERYRLSETDGARGRVALGRVIVPLDSADAATRKRYRAFAAGRVERTLAPQGERRTLFANDLVGTSDEILERCGKTRCCRRWSELRVELPYNFSGDEYEQILTDLAGRIAPELGWRAS
jgi:hypothetical protein